MCDYSLHHVASRSAKAGDRLVSTKFAGSITRGFAAVGEPDMAVCLRPGTEVAFDSDVEFEHTFGLLPRRRISARVARFRQVDMADPSVHHDALEFPGGQVVLLTRLAIGQMATVLQLPVDETVIRERQASTEVESMRDEPSILPAP